MISFLSNISVKDFLITHWRGQYSVFRSLFVNSVGGYLLISLMSVVCFRLFGASKELLIAVMCIQLIFVLYAAIGTIRSSVRALRAFKSQTVLDKLSVIVVAVLTMYICYALYNDIQRL